MSISSAVVVLMLAQVIMMRWRSEVKTKSSLHSCHDLGWIVHEIFFFYPLSLWIPEALHFHGLNDSHVLPQNSRPQCRRCIKIIRCSRSWPHFESKITTMFLLWVRHLVVSPLTATSCNYHRSPAWQLLPWAWTWGGQRKSGGAGTDNTAIVMLWEMICHILYTLGNILCNKTDY